VASQSVYYLWTDPNRSELQKCIIEKTHVKAQYYA